MSTEDKINLVLLAYKIINTRIVADGVVGQQAISAIQTRRSGRMLTRNDTNRIILALKAGGFNPALVADGVAGEELWKAEENFMTGL